MLLLQGVVFRWLLCRGSAWIKNFSVNVAVRIIVAGVPLVVALRVDVNAVPVQVDDVACGSLFVLHVSDEIDARKVV